MFSFSNGILRIKSDRSWLDLCIDVSFFLLLCSVFTNGGEKGESYFYYFTFFLFFGLTAIKLLSSLKSRGSLFVPSFTLWFSSFALLSLISVLWAANQQMSLRVISRLVQVIVITFCMAQSYSTRASLFRGIRMFSWAGTFVALYLLINTPFDEWFKGFFGMSVTQLNPNTIGMVFTLCVVVTFYFAFFCEEKIYYIFTFLQMFIIILTSSRKSLLASVAGLCMLAMLKVRRRNVVMRIFFVLGFVVAVYYLIMSVPELYSAIGVRFESMAEHMLGVDGDRSISLRQIFIENAKDMFFERPILGYGINNFTDLIYQRIGIGTYAHNNYYEILADLGIIGFAVFYGYYFFLLATLVKLCVRKSSSMAKLMLVLLVVIMICEYGLVTYYSVYVQLALCFVYLVTCAINDEDDHTYGTPLYLKYKYSVYG